MSKRPVFTISYEVEETLSLEDLWPDGDAPENPTVDDVIGIMRKSGSVINWMRDWGMEPDWIDVEVVHRLGREFVRRKNAAKEDSGA